MTTTTAINEAATSALEQSGKILDTLSPLIAGAPDAQFLRLTAALEAVGALQDALFDLQAYGQ
jgi:hypothetical protein